MNRGEEEGQLTLLSLPRELITEILKQTDPHTFENVARTSKELKEITEYDKIFDIPLKCYNSFEIDKSRIYYIKSERLKETSTVKFLSEIYKKYGKFEITKFNSEYSKIIFNKLLYVDNFDKYNLIPEFELSSGEYGIQNCSLYFKDIKTIFGRDFTFKEFNPINGELIVNNFFSIENIFKLINFNNSIEFYYIMTYITDKRVFQIIFVNIEGFKIVEIDHYKIEIIDEKKFENVDSINLLEFEGNKYFICYRNNKINKIISICQKHVYYKNLKQFLINNRYLILTSDYGFARLFVDLDDMKFLVEFDDKYLKKINEEIELNKGKLPDLIEEKDEIEETEERYELRKLKHVLENIFKYSFKIDKFKIFSIRQIEKM